MRRHIGFVIESLVIEIQLIETMSQWMVQVTSKASMMARLILRACFCSLFESNENKSLSQRKEGLNVSDCGSYLK